MQFVTLLCLIGLSVASSTQNSYLPSRRTLNREQTATSSGATVSGSVSAPSSGQGPSAGRNFRTSGVTVSPLQGPAPNSAPVRIPSGNASPCPNGQVRHVDGRCMMPRVNRRMFVYDVPAPTAASGEVEIPDPIVNTNILFIRSPEGGFGQGPIVVPPPRQNHHIYVLNKHSALGQQVIEVPAPEVTEPEVYFVNYAEGENPTLANGLDLQSALQAVTQNAGKDTIKSTSPNSHGTRQSTGSGIERGHEVAQTTGSFNQRNQNIGFAQQGSGQAAGSAVQRATPASQTNQVAGRNVGPRQHGISQETSISKVPSGGQFTGSTQTMTTGARTQIPGRVQERPSQIMTENVPVSALDQNNVFPLFPSNFGSANPQSHATSQSIGSGVERSRGVAQTTGSVVQMSQESAVQRATPSQTNQVAGRIVGPRQQGTGQGNFVSEVPSGNQFTGSAQSMATGPRTSTTARGSERPSQIMTHNIPASAIEQNNVIALSPSNYNTIR